MKRILTTVLFTVCFLLVLALSVLLFFKFEGTPPQLGDIQVPKLLGQRAEISFTVRDKYSGLRAIKVFLVQKDHTALLFQKSFPVDPFKGSSIKQEQVRIFFEPLKQSFKDGDAQLILQVRDASWRQRLQGNILQVQWKVRLDLSPPKLMVLSPLLYLTPGGSNLVLYRISEPVKRHGIRLDKRFFKGYPVKDHPGVYASLIALPVDKTGIMRLEIVAEDLAGNVSDLPVPYRLRRKHCRRDVINISDNFLKKKMPEFLDRFPAIPKGDLLKAFIWVNTKLRKIDNERISQLTHQSQVKGFYLKGAMLRLPHAATRAFFGDQRTYYYHHRKIGFAVHLGIDLASVAGAPVPAAEDGQVVFADYLGIYGNTVIVDHGYGLFSLYAHLAGFKVGPGDRVKRGQVLGYTDTTGLAGGDHLHFAVLVQGVFVEPKEWLDPQWVRTRVLNRLRQLGP